MATKAKKKWTRRVPKPVNYRKECSTLLKEKQRLKRIENSLAQGKSQLQQMILEHIDDPETLMDAVHTYREVYLDRRNGSSPVATTSTTTPTADTTKGRRAVKPVVGLENDGQPFIKFNSYVGKLGSYGKRGNRMQMQTSISPDEFHTVKQQIANLLEKRTDKAFSLTELKTQTRKLRIQDWKTDLAIRFMRDWSNPTLIKSNLNQARHPVYKYIGNGNFFDACTDAWNDAVDRAFEEEGLEK